MKTIFGPSPDHGEVPKPTLYEREEYHDFLERFMASDFFEALPNDTQLAVIVCRDTLCWTLGHENETFALNMGSWSEYFKNHHGKQDSFRN